MEQRTQRLACYDRMRVLSVVAVAAASIANRLVNWGAADGQKLGFTWHLANLVDSAAQFAVPLILMVVGALLLGKEESADLKAVLRRRVLTLLLPLAVWSVIYALFRFVWQGVSGENFVLSEAVRSVLHTPTASHLWVFYLLIAVYLALPLLRVLVQHAPRSLLIYAVVLWLIYSSVWPALSALFPALALPSYGSLTVLAGYLGYPLLGWLLATAKTVPHTRWIVTGWVSGVLITAISTALLTASAGEANLVTYQACMPNIVLMSVCAFLFCRAYDRPTVFSPWLTPMAQHAFGMYAVHELLALLLQPLMQRIPGLVSLLFFPALVWLLSLVLAVFLRRTKGTRLVFLGRVEADKKQL